MKIENKNVSRRAFLKTTAAASAAVMLSKTGAIYAAGPEKIRLGLIGCGGRGTGALANCIDAAKYINLPYEVVATADFFKQKAEYTGAQYGVPAERCFGGANGFKDLLKTNVDLVLLATPPIFRPRHFEAAIQAGKHVFMEKPVAVDPPGARSVIATGELAKQKGLSVVAGTQRRHSRGYRRTQYAIEKGAIGPILGGAIWWCTGRLWYKEKEPGESDASYMVRNWTSFTEMSGDHIVEQHVHNIDIANWFIGRTPKSVLGFGGRARRKTGDQFDFFSIDLDYDKGLRIHSMCRQVNGCYDRVTESFTGPTGTTWGDKLIPSEPIKFNIPNFPEYMGMIVQEHVDLLNSIVKGDAVNEARNVAESTMTAIMSRISAYSGKLIRWSELVNADMNSPWYNLTLKPTPIDFENEQVTAPKDDVVAIPGTA